MGQIALAGALLVYACVRLALDGFSWIRALMVVSSIAWIWTAIINWRAKRNGESGEAQAPDPAPLADLHSRARGGPAPDYGVQPSCQPAPA
jgi:hypothetical protein